MRRGYLLQGWGATAALACLLIAPLGCTSEGPQEVRRGEWIRSDLFYYRAQGVGCRDYTWKMRTLKSYVKPKTERFCVVELDYRNPFSSSYFVGLHEVWLEDADGERYEPVLPSSWNTSNAGLRETLCGRLNVGEDLDCEGLEAELAGRTTATFRLPFEPPPEGARPWTLYLTSSRLFAPGRIILEEP